MKPGDVLEGRFRIERLAGTGGAGLVYRGVDLERGAPVAIKVARAGPDERFSREIAALGALRHSGIVGFLGQGTVDDQLYLVMEWLEGEDLGARLARAPLGADEAVAIVRQIAGALGAAHRQGIVHRDVKPSNVFLVGGAAKLLDFGIARHAGVATLTASGVVVGTPAYMAPEQARGRSELDARVDVYALGALLFHCLAGRPPFEADSVEGVVLQILTQPVPRLEALVPGLSRDLAALVASLLAKDPGQRPPDGAAVAAALDGRDVTLAAPAPASSIAVLPFLDLSEARDQGYLCDGIAEELINALTQVEGLRVAARSASFRFKGATSDPKEIGARLGVGAVLEGGVRRAGGRLRVTVQLVDVGTGYQRWSHRFDGLIDDVFAIQDEIARGVATALRGLLSRRESEALRRPETRPEAYELTLRARELLYRMSPASYAAATELFERAVAVDARYPLAYTGLAQLHTRYAEWGGGGAEVRDAADRASRKALELAPRLSDSHVARGQVLKMRRAYDEAEASFQEAIRLNASSFEAHYLYGVMCIQAGRSALALAPFRRGAELQPDDFQCPLLLEQCLRGLGREAEARAAGEEGIRRAERQLALVPDDTRALSLAAPALFFAGQRDRAVEWAGRASAAAPEDPAVLYNVACAYATMGEKEAALACLERTVGRGMGPKEWIERDPDLDPLRDDPRFQELLRKLS